MLVIVQISSPREPVSPTVDLVDAAFFDDLVGVSLSGLARQASVRVRRSTVHVTTCLWDCLCFDKSPSRLRILRDNTILSGAALTAGLLLQRLMAQRLHMATLRFRDVAATPAT